MSLYENGRPKVTAKRKLSPVEEINAMAEGETAAPASASGAEPRSAVEEINAMVAAAARRERAT